MWRRDGVVLQGRERTFVLWLDPREKAASRWSKCFHSGKKNTHRKKERERKKWFSFLHILQLLRKGLKTITLKGHFEHAPTSNFDIGKKKQKNVYDRRIIRVDKTAVFLPVWPSVAILFFKPWWWRSNFFFFGFYFCSPREIKSFDQTD